MRIAVFFPGIGYTNDKPLMYYSKKLAKELYYDITEVNYSGFDTGIKGNEQKMLAAYEHGLRQANEILANIDWDRYEEIIFVGKSIGTAIGAGYAINNGLNVKAIYLTPLEQTFMEGMPEGIAFSGTADPWVNPELIRELAMKFNMPLHVYENTNHSLENEDTVNNISVLMDVMAKIKAFL